MSVIYSAIGWNRQKVRYDLALIGGILVYLGLFIGLGLLWNPNSTAETLLIRGFGTCGFLLLHVVLVIGPLCRISPRFLPLLYNRRHLGVTTFLLAAAHGLVALFQFHALGNVNPIVSLFAGNVHYGSLSNFPFQILGFAALVILFLMAATSHDFWLAALTAPVWKRFHMLVYVAYALLVAHVTLGVLQSERSIWLSLVLVTGVLTVLSLHLIAAFKERRLDRTMPVAIDDGFIDVCSVLDIPEKRAHIALVAGERVAIFKYDGKISAISNVCQHQNGPLGEGRIINGCVTCPWHGFQYLPETGASPAPFEEKVPTFRVRLREAHILVDPVPNPAGCFVEAARIPDDYEASEDA